MEQEVAKLLQKTAQELKEAGIFDEDSSKSDGLYYSKEECNAIILTIKATPYGELSRDSVKVKVLRQLVSGNKKQFNLEMIQAIMSCFDYPKGKKDSAYILKNAGKEKVVSNQKGLFKYFLTGTSIGIMIGFILGGVISFIF